jgi:hypothetical protein
LKALAGALAVIALANPAQAQGVISERNVSTQLAGRLPTPPWNALPWCRPSVAW